MSTSNLPRATGIKFAPNDYMELLIKIERDDVQMFSKFAPALRSSVAIYKDQKARALKAASDN